MRRLCYIIFPHVNLICLKKTLRYRFQVGAVIFGLKRLIGICGNSAVTLPHFTTEETNITYFS